MKYYIRKNIYRIIKYIYILKNKKLRLGHNVEIKMTSKFEGWNKISDNSYFSGEIGYASYIGKNAKITGKIGRFCSIADNVTFLTKTHPTEKFVSTHPAFYSLKKQSGFTYVEEQIFDEEPKIQGEDYSIEIGNDVYIGFGVTIIGPVKIGDGVIIAANSIVTKDIEPYSIVISTNKVIRKRYSDEEILFLLDLKWWNKDERWLKKYAKYFNSLKNLKEILEIV